MPALNRAGRQALMARLQERAESKPSENASCVALRNMFDGNAPDFDEPGIREDVSQEARRFGRLLRCVVERHSGTVYLQFADAKSAQECW